MLLRISILVTLISFVWGSAVPEKALKEREGRFWWIDKSKNKTSGDGSGDYTGGDVTIGEGGGDFTNPKEYSFMRPINVETRQSEDLNQFQHKATLLPPEGTEQIKIVINDLNLFGPSEGDCINDTIVFRGANPGLEIPVLCGRIIEPQTIYIGIDNSDGPYEIVGTFLCCVSYPLVWNMSVSYLPSSGAIVEHRCLQYHTEPNGIIRSFNFAPTKNSDGPWGMMLNDQEYSICFGYVKGYCNIALNFERFDLGRINGACGDSYLLIGDDKYCGDYAEYNGGLQVMMNATGPMNIGVRSGSMNENEEEGFTADYTMLGC